MIFCGNLISPASLKSSCSEKKQTFEKARICIDDCSASALLLLLFAAAVFIVISCFIGAKMINRFEICLLYRGRFSVGTPIYMASYISGVLPVEGKCFEQSVKTTFQVMLTYN